MTNGADRLPEPGRVVLADLYRRYGPWLVARIRGRFGVENAEDVVQETWLRIVPIGVAGDIRHPKALLLRIASNLAINQRRQAVRQAEILEAAGRVDGLGAQADEQTQTVLLRQIILGLPEPLHDRIVIGEMRDGAAALETLKSWNTGHPGGLSTVHANSATEALRRMEDLIGEVTSLVPRHMIGDAVDCVVHISRTPSGRRVEAVIAVGGFEAGGYAVQSLA